MNDVIDQAQETLEWSTKNNQLSVVVSIGLAIVLGVVLWFAFKVLVTERKEWKEDSKKWNETLTMAQALQASQQEIISQQQDVITDQQIFITDQQKYFETQKAIISDIDLSVKDINNKVDIVLGLKQGA